MAKWPLIIICGAQILTVWDLNNVKTLKFNKINEVNSGDKVIRCRDPDSKAIWLYDPQTHTVVVWFLLYCARSIQKGTSRIAGRMNEGL